MKPFWTRALSESSDLLLAVAIIGILLVLFGHTACGPESAIGSR